MDGCFTPGSRCDLDESNRCLAARGDDLVRCLDEARPGVGPLRLRLAGRECRGGTHVGVGVAIQSEVFAECLESEAVPLVSVVPGFVDLDQEASEREAAEDDGDRQRGHVVTEPSLGLCNSDGLCHPDCRGECRVVEAFRSLVSDSAALNRPTRTERAPRRSSENVYSSP